MASGRSAPAGPHRSDPSDASWRRIDLHLHTAASGDYQEPKVTALDLLRCAEARELDIIAFTDHNSVRGYADLWREIEDLELLEYLKRLEPAERDRLEEYRRLLGRVLLLPGFEFTATFGFHVLAIFPEGTSVRLMEHLLLLLGVPEERFGSGEVGATTDVLRAYEILAQHGALVIGAHVNSTHGVAMQGLRFGGQTKIAYTQDEHLHALEVTDLVLDTHRRSTARFFSGIKAEYPRRMHCIQGSDAHRLERDPQRDSNLGVGDRATEVLLPEVSFAALKALFLSDAFERTRPAQPDLDEVSAARVDGNTASQAFHENLSTKRTGLGNVLRDIVALANGEGGTVFVGASPFEKRPIAGVPDAESASAEVRGEVAAQIAPLPEVAFDVLSSSGKQVLAIRVARGGEKPYALQPGAIFVRVDGESVQASRDQIVAMVREGSAPVGPRAASAAAAPIAVPPASVSRASGNGASGAEVPSPASSNGPLAGSTQRQDRRPLASAVAMSSTTKDGGSAGGEGAAPATLEEYQEQAETDPVTPTTGVEVVSSFEQDGVRYYTLRDLRYHKLIHNVTRQTGRRLWRSAIVQREEQPVDEADGRWRGDHGFWRSYRSRGGERRYNLLYRGEGDLRVFYGVSEGGMDERWRSVLPVERSAAKV